MKKVSVIVPVYNVAYYLPKCLDSLVGQTLQEIEILVIDDGSTDHSAKIMAHYQSKYPEKIKIFSKKNGGLSDARNYGLDRATGDFIGFVDSDDYVDPMMFETMYGLAQMHKAEIVICNLQKVDEYGQVTQRLTQIPNMPEKIDLEQHFSVFSDISYFACNKLFSRSLFENKRFKKGVHFEDIELIPQLFLEASILAHTQNYYYHYLERSDSITKTHTEKGLDILHAVEKVEEVFQKSRYHMFRKEMRGFLILEGFYTYLAYLAYVKDPKVYTFMSERLKNFLSVRGISKKEILQYRRFGRNYLVSLPIKKQIYYILYLIGLEGLIRKII